MKIFLVITALVAACFTAFWANSGRYADWIVMTPSERSWRRWQDRLTSDADLAPNKELSRFGATKRRVSSIQQLPDDVRAAFVGTGSIKDRKEPWNGGCGSLEPHFLEAGQTERGWWIFYEYGGIVSGYQLAFVHRDARGTKVSERYYVSRD